MAWITIRDHYLITVNAIDVIVRSIGEVGGIHLVLTLGAGEALLVIGAGLGDLLLRLENKSMAPMLYGHLVLADI